MSKHKDIEIVKRIKALADTGLVYAENDYDIERYEELRTLSLQLLEKLSGQPFIMLEQFFMPEKDYPTVKVDVRGVVLNDSNELLMAKELSDGKWTIPGGWADVGYSPSEVIIKEIEEETGLNCTVTRLLAVYDKRMHAHPPQPFYIYKLIFLCELKGGILKPGFDMGGANFFPISKLPPLSEDRILESQIMQLMEMISEKNFNVYFD